MSNIDIDIIDIYTCIVFIHVVGTCKCLYWFVAIDRLVPGSVWRRIVEAEQASCCFDVIFFSFLGEGAVKEPPKNSRAAGLKSDERVKRDINRKRSEESVFEQEKLLFERERASLLESRDQGGWVHR